MIQYLFYFSITIHKNNVVLSRISIFWTFKLEDKMSECLLIFRCGMRKGYFWYLEMPNIQSFFYF